jgi:hypothetical protein
MNDCQILLITGLAMGFSVGLIFGFSVAWHLFKGK